MGRSSTPRPIEHARVRVLNESLRVAAETNPVATGIRLVCECGREACVQTIDLELEDFEAIRWRDNVYVIAPGHERPDTDRVVEAHEEFVLVT